MSCESEFRPSVSLVVIPTGAQLSTVLAVVENCLMLPCFVSNVKWLFKVGDTEWGSSACGFLHLPEDSGISWHLGMNAVEKGILCRGEHSPGFGYACAHRHPLR